MVKHKKHPDYKLNKQIAEDFTKNNKSDYVGIELLEDKMILYFSFREVSDDKVALASFPASFNQATEDFRARLALGLAGVRLVLNLRT